MNHEVRKANTADVGDILIGSSTHLSTNESPNKTTNRMSPKDLHSHTQDFTIISNTSFSTSEKSVKMGEVRTHESSHTIRKFVKKDI